MSFDSLSPAQQRCVAAVALGWPHKVTAHRLGLDEATVKTHISNAYRVLGFRRRKGLVRLALCYIDHLPPGERRAILASWRDEE